MDYRSDLEAARLRINTLEAKLDENEATLRTRDAELAERNAELARLRPGKGSSSGISTGTKVALLIGSHVVVAGFFLGLGSKFLFGNQPVVVSVPEPTVIENGPVAEGKTPPPERPLPAVHVEGKTPPPEVPDPPAQAEGTATSTENQTLAEQVDATQDRMKGEVNACHKKQREKKSDAHGTINVVFDIEPTGRISRVTLSGLLRTSDPWWTKEFETCVVAAYEKLTFRPYDGSKTTAKASFLLHSRDLGF